MIRILNLDLTAVPTVPFSTAMESNKHLDMPPAAAPRFTRCRLLDDLPREVRDAIYEYAFTDNVVSIDNNWLEVKRRPCDAGLVFACRQLHDETVELYYKLSIFHAANFRSVLHWLQRLPKKYIALVTEVRCDRMTPSCSGPIFTYHPCLTIFSRYLEYRKQVVRGTPALAREVLKIPVYPKSGEPIWTSDTDIIKGGDPSRNGTTQHGVTQYAATIQNADGTVQHGGMLVFNSGVAGQYGFM